MRAAALSLGLLGACAADTAPSTQLVLVADTDIADLDQITFEVRGSDARRETAQAARTSSSGPSYVTLVRDMGPLDPLTITARGLTGGVERVRRVHTASFVVDETRIVSLHLLARCAAVTCPATMTCGEMGCRAQALTELPAWLGEVPRLAGAADAGADAGGGAGTAMQRCGEAGRVDLQTSPLHCGACDHACGRGRVCRAGGCVAR